MRLGKLPVTFALEELPVFLEASSFKLLAIDPQHVLAEVVPWPDTNDPFDRLLLAQCQVEGLRLLTVDRKLIDHPLAWRAAAA